jgi:hypothetical protein
MKLQKVKRLNLSENFVYHNKEELHGESILINSENAGKIIGAAVVLSGCLSGNDIRDVSWGNGRTYAGWLRTREVRRGTYKRSPGATASFLNEVRRCLKLLMKRRTRDAAVSISLVYFWALFTSLI